VPLDPALLKAIGDYGLAIVLIVVLLGVVWYFIRDLVKQRDAATAGWKAQSDATQQLAVLGQQGHEHAEQRDQQMRDLTDAVRRLEGRRSR
jgi:hypothetical protein